jgi:hypothetical protein
VGRALLLATNLHQGLDDALGVVAMGLALADQQLSSDQSIVATPKQLDSCLSLVNFRLIQKDVDCPCCAHQIQLP